MIVSSQTMSHEYRYLDADDPLGEFKIFLPRARGHEYQIDHFADRFLIRTNDQAKNFRLMCDAGGANRGASIGAKSFRTATMFTWATSICSKIIWFWKSGRAA